MSSETVFKGQEDFDIEQDSNNETLSMQERLEMAQEKKDQVRKEFISAKDVNVKETDDGETIVDIPIQSLSQDRDGDKIDEDGQNEAIRQLESGTVGMFPNHGIGDGDAIYDFRDLFGQFVDGHMEEDITVGRSRMRKAMDDKDELHPHAKQVVDLLKQDMPIGFSVGFIPTDTSPKDNGDGMIIHDLDLMEVSAVGIPSNPDAVPQAMDSAVAMAKSAREKGADEETIAKAFDEALKNAMTSKEQDAENNESGKSEEQENSSTEKELSQKFNEDEVEEIMGVVGGAVESHVNEAMQEIEEQLQEEGNPEEEEEGDKPEDEEEDSSDGEDEDDEEMSQESSGSGQTEDSEQESSEPENQDSETEEEKGLSDEEKTVNQKDNEDSENKINTVDDSEDKDNTSEDSENKINDPFKITEDSKA